MDEFLDEISTKALIEVKAESNLVVIGADWNRHNADQLKSTLCLKESEHGPTHRVFDSKLDYFLVSENCEGISELHEPLNPDDGQPGTASDHRIVVTRCQTELVKKYHSINFS
jgi:hypothetical protein